MSMFNIALPNNFDTNDPQAVKQVASYLYSLNEQLRYMFGNMEPEDNFSGQALSKYVQVGEDIATLNFDVGGLKVTVVRKGEVVSAINMSPEEIKIMAAKISLEGITTINGNFKVLLDGSILARNGTFSGDISGSLIKGSQITGSLINVGCLYADDDFCQVGNFVSTQSARDIFQSCDETIGMSTNPGTTGGLWFWAGWYSSWDYLMAINSGGVYCGRDLHVLGDCYINGTLNCDYIDCSTIYSSEAGESWSDRRLKDDIKRLPSSKMKDFILRLKPVSYRTKKGREGIGFVAQDVIQTCDRLGIDLPFTGRLPKTKYYTIPYQHYIAPMVATIQEQEKEIGSLKKRIDKLERMVRDGSRINS